MPTLEIAIVDSNILSALGLQLILTDIIPSVEVNCFISFDALQAADHGQFVHYFVASRIYFEHVAYFRENGRRVIVLVNGELQVAGVPTLNVCQPENALVKSLLAVHRKGHPHGVPSHGEMSHHPHQSPSLLSQREIEVAILLARGFINKEIADKLCISVTTVITHRKNIMEKLGARSLADIIIYVVMNGLVDVGEL
jgi:DNA-binding CsgD family transcriptional regulator